MKLSFCDVTLTLATPEIDDFLSTYLSSDLLREEDSTNWVINDLSELNTPNFPGDYKPQYGRLYWPIGACRPAYFHQAITSSKLDEIRTAVGSGDSPQDLVLDDGRDSSTIITVPMYLLPARPLMQITGAEQLYLLSLTDSRSLLKWKSGSLTTKPASWTALYSTLATAMGITLSHDTISSSYGTPSSRWVIFDHSLPGILDAVANTIGQRIVANFDGTFSAVNWDSAKSASDALWTAQLANLGASKTAGGEFVLGDLVRWVPASVLVAFKNTSTGATAPYEVTKTLAGLAISEYGGAAGLTGYTRTIIADLIYDGTNAAACANYATQAATDWYGWALANLDVSLPGIVNWNPTGWEDAVEVDWQIQEAEHEKIITRLHRGPWMDYQPGFISTNSCLDTVVTNVCVEKLFASGFLQDINISVEKTDSQCNVACVINPNDCCEVHLECGPCADFGLPQTLYFRALSPCGPGQNPITTLKYNGDHWVRDSDITCPNCDSLCLYAESFTCVEDGAGVSHYSVNVVGCCPGTLIDSNVALTVASCNPFCAYHITPANAGCFPSGCTIMVAETPDAADCSNSSPTHTSLGTTTASGNTTNISPLTATISGVTVPSVSMLVVSVLVASGDVGTGPVIDSVTFRGDALGATTPTTITKTSVVRLSNSVWAAIIYSTLTADIVVEAHANSSSPSSTGLVVNATYYNYLDSYDSTGTIAASGLAGLPDAGSSFTGTFAPTSTHAALGLFDISPPALGTWQNGFTAGQTTTLSILGGTATLRDGYKIITSGNGPVDAATNDTREVWTAIMEIFT